MQSFRSHLKINYNLAYPVMLSQLGHILVGTADSMMVGQTGEVPLAGAALGSVPFHILMTFGLGISYGATPLIAAADGEGDHSRIGSLLRNSFFINVIAAIVLFLIIILGNGVLYHLDQPKDVVALAIPYLEIITVSIIPLMIFQTFRQFMEGLSITKPAMFISIFSNILNVGLNYILIFGKLGFEPMGLNGAGIATLISRVVMMLLIIVYFYRETKFAPYRKNILSLSPEWLRVKRILKIGLPSAFQYIIEVGAFGIAVIMMGWIGTSMQAAHQIAINLAAITYMMATGLGAAATIRSGNQLGRKNIPNLRRAVYSLVFMAIIFMAFNALLFILGRNFLPHLYIDNAEVIKLASGLLIIAALFQISDGLQVVMASALRGLEDTLVPTFYIFVAYILIGIPLGYYLGIVIGWGGIGIWTGLLVGLTIVATSLLVRFNRLTKKLSLKYN